MGSSPAVEVAEEEEEEQELDAPEEREDHSIIFAAMDQDSQISISRDRALRPHHEIHHEQREEREDQDRDRV
jgi:hypothetical protein